ncbi:hypothetical protein JKP88DRAFT_233847 [Tribonema minus]|uniref:Secreted protein n=1 Tax=Tribonema minus TaxID=303371 RepID=A0A835Z3Y1_9STRA|nr:hypothetical protein JKP88DRAFT_239084 [Tribonema minus]KAG5182656.1 hypothetical protein JKP88DRAFT_238713 [Tribonema minus]KAG5182659.1 hypothetical protein JKP88DRAFT_238729 [Tribonema minus]KAG5183817.1 hypothetical protein JKP88DRAFT_238206 [Tribonema minus]KAG5188855.1 hypothetical protein JKP88DRAFT_233847 [Tribonema minus]
MRLTILTILSIICARSSQPDGSPGTPAAALSVSYAPSPRPFVLVHGLSSTLRHACHCEGAAAHQATSLAVTARAVA